MKKLLSTCQTIVLNTSDTVKGAPLLFKKYLYAFGGLIAFNVLVKHTNKHSFLLLLQMKLQREQKASNWTNLGL